VNKSELISEIAKSTEMTQKDVGAVLDAFEATVTKHVAKGEKIAITGFITFDRVERKARVARNPQTGEPIKVAASKAPKISAGAKFKAAVKGKK
jgi:DNA-binding protein HU-beta